jgi:hypothetical protein
MLPTRRQLTPFIVLLTSACVPLWVEFTPFADLPRPADPRRPTDKVEIFASGPPAVGHIDVGMIQASSGSAMASPGELLAAIREEAGKQGCDAIVVNPPGRLNHPDGLSATCVRYLAAPGSRGK